MVGLDFSEFLSEVELYIFARLIYIVQRQACCDLFDIPCAKSMSDVMLRTACYQEDDRELILS